MLYDKFLISMVFHLSFVHSDGVKSIKKLSNKEAYGNLKNTIPSIKLSCGEVCNLSIEGNVHSKILICCYNLKRIVTLITTTVKNRIKWK